MINRSQQFILELDDNRYRLQGDNLHSVEGTATAVTGDKWIVSDFEGATPQVMTVDSPLKYVDAVIEKRLRENGALVGGGRVLILRKHRRGSRATEAFFVAVPSALYAKYAAGAEDDDDHQLVFPLHMLLSRGLENLRSKKPAAFVFVHDRHVDILVGNTTRSYGAFRASRRRSGEDQSKLIENITNGLRAIEQQNNIKIKNIHFHYWLVEHLDDIQWTQDLARDMDIPGVQPTFGKLNHEGQSYYSSITGLLAKLSTEDSISTPTQKIAYRAQQVMPWAAAVLLGVSLLALGTTTYWNNQTRDLTVESSIIESSFVLPEPGPVVLKAAYEEPLALADTLGRAQISPSIQSVLAEVSASVTGQVTFDELVVEYPGDRPLISLLLIGQSEKPEDDDGVSAFNGFLSALRQRGYTLVNSELKSDINVFSFLIQLERSLN